MADENIIIEKSKSTAALEATGTVKEMVYIKTGTAAQKATAMAILSGISNKNWIVSDSVEGKKGEIVDTILLPEKITNG